MEGEQKVVSNQTKQNQINPSTNQSNQTNQTNQKLNPNPQKCNIF
jgi:hypothetical protein